MSEQKQKFFIIGSGLCGGFGGIKNYEVIKSSSLENALEYAEIEAKEEYQRYEGCHGLRSIDEIMDEEGIDYDDAEYAYNDEVESWIEYSAEPFSKELENKYKNYH